MTQLELFEPHPSAQKIFKDVPHPCDFFKNWQPRHAAYDRWHPERQSEERRLQAIMELTGEAGEVLQVATKAFRNGQDIPRDKIVDELGDTFWGLVGIMNEFDISFEELVSFNVQKLELRYQESGKEVVDGSV